MASATARAETAQTRSSAQAAIQVDAPSRREFLYYIWGASIALLLGESTALLIWFIFPRFKAGEFGGVVPFNPSDLPSLEAAPQTMPAGRFHMAHTEGGVTALYQVCTHLGCLPKWVPTNHRFECPCHGSKFQLNGDWIEGPAPRHLDRFPMTVTYADTGEIIETDADGNPIQIDFNRPISNISVNTGSRIVGKLHG